MFINPGAMYAVLVAVLPLADFAAASITPSTPYSILGVTPFSSPSQVDDAYHDLQQTLQRQNKQGLWSGKGDQELPFKQEAELHDAYLTLSDPLERCYWHRDTGVRDWYGVPALCWDEIVRDKLQMLRDAVAQGDFSKLTWLPRPSRHSPFPVDQKLQQSEQATETSIEQEVPVIASKTSEPKTSRASSNTEAATKVTLESTSIKANGNPNAKVDWFSAIGTLFYPVAVAVPELRSWLGTNVAVLHSKISVITQSVLASFPILVSYPQAVLVQAESWLVIIWAWISVAITAVWSYLTTSFKLVREYLMPLAPYPSSDTIPTANGPRTTIMRPAGFNADIFEEDTVLTKLTSLRPSYYTTATTNPLRYQSQSRSYKTGVVTEPVLLTQPTFTEFPVSTVTTYNSRS
ncbi:hypothetical protein QBC40DRAFT_186011 [Triangularia verruculosa]|uniref:J domain-containing protein n=1 Tax=Triangularia verruculosa TaxID=2587418 RepID=A0AAN6X9A0_9PEZI|nr:hypothetical protein QBC40DRAFT_186011 [Triangularia verruculosa]